MPLTRITRRARAGARWVAGIDPLVYLPRRRGAEPPTVGVVGYYGWGNYGDELFWEIFRTHLTDFSLRSVIEPDRRGRRDLSRAVRASDAMLVGGGDLVVSWLSNSSYFDPIYLRRPVFIAGVGVPVAGVPIEGDHIAGVPPPRPSHPRAIARLRRFFRHPSVRFVAARDDESAAWIAQNLEPRAGVVTSPDLVCALELPEVDRIADPPVFGIVVRGRAAPTDLGNVRRLCERAESLGYRVRRIVLANRRIVDRDLPAAAALAMPHTELVVSDDLDELTRAIGECSVLASMKFHGTVVATMYGIPSIVLTPSAKTRNFVRRIGRPDLLSAYYDPDLPERLTADMTSIDPATIADLRSGAIDLLSTLQRELIEELPSHQGV